MILARLHVSLPVAITLGLALGMLIAVDPRLALLAALVVLAGGLSAVSMLAIPLIAAPGIVLIMRVGGGEQAGISMSDLILFVALVPALLLLRRRGSPELGRLLLLVGLYQAVTLLTVIWNPYRANIIEWFHAALLTGGALVVGYVLGREGAARVALGLYVGACTLIGAWASLEALISLAAGSVAPVYLPYMHKNFIGCMLGFAVVVAYARPSWLGWPRWASNTALVTCMLGIFAAQSRQALIGVAVSLAYVLLRERHRDSRSWLPLAAMVPIGLFVFRTTQDQIASGNQFNSINQRLTWYEQALEVWETSPLVGVGMRWWYTDRFPYGFQPPNAEIEVLTSAGILGLIAFLITVAGFIFVLARMDPRYGTLAAAVVIARIVQAQFDLFWVAAQASAPFLIAGVCVGALARERAGSLAPGKREQLPGSNTLGGIPTPPAGPRRSSSAKPAEQTGFSADG